jgi:hypothetical protein
MYLRLGYIDHLVISNGEMAKEVLKVHDADFGSRPRSIIGKYVSFDWSDITLSPCGDHWRLLRKICITELLTQARLNNFQWERQDEVAYMVEEIAKHNQGRPQLVEMRPIFHQLTSNNMCRMMFGARRKELKNHLGNNFDDLFNSLSDMVEIFNNFNVSDLIPILKPFDLQGLERRMKSIRNRLENNLSNILKEYRKGNKLVFDSTAKSFVQVLLNLDEKLDDKSIMATLMVCAFYSTYFNKMCASYILYIYHHFVMFFFLTHKCLLVFYYRTCLGEERIHLQYFWNGH